MSKMSSFFEFTAAIRELVPDMPVSKRVFLAKHMADLMNMGHTNISRDGMQSIMYWLKVTHEISEYQYMRINDMILESEKLRVSALVTNIDKFNNYHGNCPFCGKMIHYKTTKYCPYCGKEVKWET